MNIFTSLPNSYFLSFSLLLLKLVLVLVVKLEGWWKLFPDLWLLPLHCTTSPPPPPTLPLKVLWTALIKLCYFSVSSISITSTGEKFEEGMIHSVYMTFTLAPTFPCETFMNGCATFTPPLLGMTSWISSSAVTMVFNEEAIYVSLVRN